MKFYKNIFVLIGFLLISQACFGYSGGPQKGIDIGENARAINRMSFQVGTGSTFVMRYGTTTVTGSGSTGYMSGTDSAYPRWVWTPATGRMNFLDITLQQNGVDLPSAGSVSGKIDAVGGTGTTNVFTDMTLAGLGTITGSFRANGLVVSPAEYSAVNNATGELQSQITTIAGSTTNHAHTGSDGTAQVSHTNLTNKGTQTHVQIDDFIASKASASGLASLDGSSLVVQNPANATSVTGANKIIMSGGTNKISDGWLSNNVTKLGTPTTSNISEGSNLYHTDARVNTLIGNTTLASLSDTQNAGTATDGQFLKKVGNKWQGAASSVTTYWSDILGNPASGTSANSYISSTPAANKIPYSTDGNLGNWVTSLPSVTGNSNFPGGIWNSAGNVGIGTTSPRSKFDVTSGTSNSAGDAPGTALITGPDAGAVPYSGTLSLESNDAFAIDKGGSLVFKGRTITSQTDASALAAIRGVKENSTSGNYSGYLAFHTRINGGSMGERMRITSDGYVGIGTSTPSAQLHTTGSVRFATLGSGAVQSDASGNLSVSSDERLKDIQGNFTAGLSELLGIEPILYKFNKLSGLETENTYAGFSAQNVMQYIPDAVGQDGKGYYTLNDRPIVAALVNSVKKLQEEIEELQKTNNVEVKIYKASPRVKPKLVYTKDICLNDVECPDAVDTHEYIEENTEDDWLGISKEDAFETIAICENIQTGTETTYSYKLEGTESVRVCAEKPVYAKVETEKTEIKLKQDIKFDSENGVFYQKVSVPKLVYKLKSDYSYKDDKYYRKETIEEAKIRMGRE